MRKQLFISTIICILLAACAAPKSTPTSSPSATFAPSATVTLTIAPTVTPKPTRTQSPPTPTFTPFPPYPTKKVVFEYLIAGNLSDFSGFYDECCDQPPNIVIYDDGQMIINGWQQKILSAAEIKKFISKLDDLGFFSLESNQKRDSTDKLYDFGNQYQKITGGLSSCIKIQADKSRQLCVKHQYMQFVIPEMKEILNYLDAYQPSGLTPYYPDRILLSIQPAYPDQLDLPATPWDQDFPPLDIPQPRTYLDNPPSVIIYINGEMADKIYTFLSDSKTNNIFIQNHKKYIVYFSVVLPHQTVVNAYQ